MDPVDQIREIIHEGGPDTLSKIADVLGAPPAEQPAEPDQQLCRFYQVQTFPELVSAMERHIERLQAKLPRGEQPAFTRAREG